jgi:hypothetical protein
MQIMTVYSGNRFLLNFRLDWILKEVNFLLNFFSECILFKLLAITALELLFYKIRKIKGHRSLTKTIRHISIFYRTLLDLPLAALVVFVN